MMMLRRVRVGRLTRPVQARWNSEMASAAERMEAKMREMALREEEDSEAVEEEVEEDMEAYIRDAFSSAGFSEQDFAKPGSFTSTELPEQPAKTTKGLFSTSTATALPAPSALMEAAAKHLPLPEAPPNASEAEYAASLVHGRAFHTAPRHPITSGHPVALIQLRSYHPSLLGLFAHFASHAAYSLGIPVSGTVALPKRRSLWTVLRGPFVHKKSQENFERIDHRRVIKAWDADEEVVQRWIAYLERHNMAGVGMRIVRWERMRSGLEGWKDARTVEKEHIATEMKIRDFSQRIVKEEMTI